MTDLFIKSQVFLRADGGIEDSVQEEFSLGQQQQLVGLQLLRLHRELEHLEHLR